MTPEQPMTHDEQAADDIRQFRRFLTAMFPGSSYVTGKKQVTHDHDTHKGKPHNIDPDKFNRSTISIDGREYTVSVFRQSMPATDEDTSTTSRPVDPPFYADGAESDYKNDQDFLAAWNGMQKKGYRCSESNISKAYLGWCMAQRHFTAKAPPFDESKLLATPKPEVFTYVLSQPLKLPHLVEPWGLAPGVYTGHVEERDGKLVFVTHSADN